MDATNRVRFDSTRAYRVGDEVADVIVRVGGEWHAARVRVTGVVSRATEERPSWMPADSEGGRQYPLTRTTYEAEVVHSRASGPPAYSDALGPHAARLRGDD